MRSTPLSLGLVLLVVACHAPPASSPRAIAPDERFSYREVDPGFWEETAANMAVDPFQPVIQGLRDRKARDLADPSAPAPFRDGDLIPKHLAAPLRPWDDVRDVLGFDWTGLAETSHAELTQLEGVLRLRTVLAHPDLRIIEVALGPGAILPSHADPAPGALHVISGTAEVRVAGVRIQAYPGTSVRLDPLEPRRIEAGRAAPLRLLWFRFAPGGEQRYLGFGYYLTGSNFHAQPLEATMPADYQHWPDEVRVRHAVEALPQESSEPGEVSDFVRDQREALRRARAMPGRPAALYPETPLAVSELDVAWLDFTNLGTARFFWADDASSATGALRSWNRIARMKGIFQSRTPEGLYDFNMSYIANGPTGKYVTHSHATPEFYYVLGGETEWKIAGDTFTARAGSVFFHAPYQDHEMRGLVEGEPMRAITGSWAPFGDRSVFRAPMLLTEPLPTQPASSLLPGGFVFHAFDLKRLRFETAGARQSRRWR